MGGDDYYGADLPDILETSLLARGGPELLSAAHDETGRHVDQLHPWDGTGEVPAERVSDHWAALWQVSESASSDLPAP